jgi:limonene-1,2-epoxide hydrolase
VRRLALVGVALALAAAGTAQAAATPAQVVRAWSKALNANNNTAAAKLFAPNARVVQPGLDARLSTRAVAIAFNDALPCAGRIVALTVKGDRATATFVDRGDGLVGCHETHCPTDHWTTATPRKSELSTRIARLRRSVFAIAASARNAGKSGRQKRGIESSG